MLLDSILPVNRPGDCCQGKLSSKLTVEDIDMVLGFKANVADDPDKVTHSWGFTFNGERCGIWDYKGSRWSYYGRADIFKKLFGSGAVENWYE